MIVSPKRGGQESISEMKVYERNTI